METKRLLMLVVAMISTTANGEDMCIKQFSAACNNVTSPTRCTTLSYLYSKDLTCLCSIFKGSNVTNQEAYSILVTCEANLTSTTICPDSTGGTNSPPSFGAIAPAGAINEIGTHVGTHVRHVGRGLNEIGTNSPQSSPAATDSPPSSGATAGIVVGMLLLFAGVVLFLIYCCCRRKRTSQNEIAGTNGFVSNPHQPSPMPSHGGGGMFDSFKGSFKYEVLLQATDGFSNHNLLGKGGFANVYKGTLPDGKDIAVKRLKPGTCQGDSEFQMETDTISRVHHKYLVSLFGYCVHEEERLLVFEFVPNGTLESHLRGKEGKVMDWPSRMNVAIGSAKGLAYLHESCAPKVIHRDIKTANILLDFNFEPKVADFGLAKSCYDENTHVSTRVAGTFGYLAPEYAQTGQLSEKSDVYSFGVVLLEMITGRSPIDKSLQEKGPLVTWASPLMSDALESDNYDNLVDERLQKKYNPTEMARMVACAASCVRHSAKLRPQISEVIQILKGQMPVDLIQNLKLGHSLLYNSSESQGNFKIGNLCSEEFASSKHSSSMSTNEHVSNPSIIATGYSGQTLGGR